MKPAAAGALLPLAGRYRWIAEAAADECGQWHVVSVRRRLSAHSLDWVNYVHSVCRVASRFPVAGAKVWWPEQAADILVPSLLRTCLTLNGISVS